MAPQKRAGEAPRAIGRPKKIRTKESVEKVVEAIVNADALASDLRTLFKGSLPAVLEVNKSERYPYEAEVVAEAEKTLITLQACLEEAHTKALTKQTEVIAPEEHARRTQAKKSAEEDLDIAKTKLEAQEEAQNAARDVVREAKSALKAAQKEAAGVDKEIQSITDKKALLAALLEAPFVLIQENTSGSPEGKEAVKKIVKAGKECGLDSTLLQTFPITAKKEPSTRSEFEIMMLQQLKSGIDKQIDAYTQKQAEVEPSNAERRSAVEIASQNVSKAEEALAAASKDLSDAQDGQKAASNSSCKADRYLYEIWADMKAVCDEQDKLTDELKEFKDTVLTTFEKLKEKEPEAEPVEQEQEEEMAVPEKIAGDATAAADVVPMEATEDDEDAN